MTLGVEVAAGEVQERRTENWILRSPGTVGILRLKKSGKSCINTVDRRFLVGFEDVAPVFRATGIFLVVCRFVQTLRHFRDAKVVIGILNSARNTSGVGSKTEIVNIGDWDVVQILPTGKATTTFNVPVRRFNFRIGDDRFIPGVPIHALIDAF